MGGRDHEELNENTLYHALNGSEGRYHMDESIDIQTMQIQNPKRASTSKDYSKNYRIKQFQNGVKLERHVKSLQDEIIVKGSAVQKVEEHKLMLRSHNDTMKQKLSECTSQLILKRAEYEELKKETEARKNFLKSCILENPQILNNLSHTTVQLLQFTLLGEVGPSMNDHPAPILRDQDTVDTTAPIGYDTT